MKLKVNKVADPFRQLICEYTLDDADEFNNDLEKHIHQLKIEDPTGVKASNNHGWHSSADFHMHSAPAMKKLNQLILASIVNYLQQYDKTLNIKDFNVSVTSWANVNTRGGSNLMHCHPNSLISGTYYVKVPQENAPKIRFLNVNGAHYLKNKSDLGANFIKDSYSITPRAGDLVLFSSNVWHSVDTNQTDYERISIAFNAYLDKKCEE